MPPGDPPIIVVEGDDAAFEAAIAEVRRGGWLLGTGFRVTRADELEVWSGAVTTDDDAGAALLAVLAGAGAVIHARAPQDVLDRLVDDLRRVRRVELRKEANGAEPGLDEDARAILEILAEGRTLGDAAATLGLSRRTADRRLADARAALGVDRTVEAVALAKRRRWIR